MASNGNRKSAVKSPLRQVPIVIRAEGAREVILTGDFTGWATDKVRLAPVADGEWRTTLQLPAGEHQYRLIINGEWRDHAEATKRVPNAFGTQNCVLVVH